jgi:glucose-1-phosphate adenylyltransferase
VIGNGTYISPGAVVERAVLFDNVTIGRGAVVRNAIIDKNVVVPDNTLIGVHHEDDLRRGFTVSEGGVTVLGKGQIVIP